MAQNGNNAQAKASELTQLLCTHTTDCDICNKCTHGRPHDLILPENETDEDEPEFGWCSTEYCESKHVKCKCA